MSIFNQPNPSKAFGVVITSSVLLVTLLLYKPTQAYLAADFIAKLAPLCTSYPDQHPFGEYGSAFSILVFHYIGYLPYMLSLSVGSYAYWLATKGKETVRSKIGWYLVNFLSGLLLLSTLTCSSEQLMHGYAGILGENTREITKFIPLLNLIGIVGLLVSIIFMYLEDPWATFHLRKNTQPSTGNKGSSSNLSPIRIQEPTAIPSKPWEEVVSTDNVVDQPLALFQAEPVRQEPQTLRQGAEVANDHQLRLAELASKERQLDKEFELRKLELELKLKGLPSTAAQAPAINVSVLVNNNEGKDSKALPTPTPVIAAEAPPPPKAAALPPQPTLALPPQPTLALPPPPVLSRPKFELPAPPGTVS